MLKYRPGLGNRSIEGVGCQVRLEASTDLEAGSLAASYAPPGRSLDQVDGLSESRLIQTWSACVAIPSFSDYFRCETY